MNGINYKPVLTVLLLQLLITLAANAQLPKNIDGLNNKINLYGIKSQSPVLFIHFDKTIYTNNENVWFTAYLFGADYQKYKTLSVALVRDDSRAVLMEDRFVISNGIAFGHTIVPDSVGPGNYTFIATTNRLKNGKPDVIFTQAVTIKTADQQSYSASLNPVDTSVTATEQKVMLSLNFVNPKAMPATVPVKYYIGNFSHPVLKDSVKTKAGQYIFTIPSKLLSQGNNTLHVLVKYKKEEKDISINLPTPPQPAIVRFYPEGGNLVNNIQSTVGWEVKSAAGNPIEVNALLYEDKKVLDTLSTNSYGLGIFSLMPKAGSNYAVKLKDTLYQLPTALASGPAISIINAIVNDTLTVNIKDEQHEKLYLIGHNYKQLFFAQPITMTTITKRIRFILKNMPKGLTQLTLTDSTGRPFAERTFFAHYDQRTPLSITTDMGEYAARKKVTVKVKLEGQADSGFVSVACVQENRIEAKKKNDIESYLYLKHDLGNLPIRETYLTSNEADKQFLENVLLVKGWSRYTWTDMLKTEPTDTVRKYENLTFKGNVVEVFSATPDPHSAEHILPRSKERPIKKSVSIINLNRPLDPFATDNTGGFTLKEDGLVTLPYGKVTLRLNNHDEGNYQTHIADPYTGIDKVLAQHMVVGNYTTQLESTQYMQLADNEHATLLKEVNITEKKDDDAIHGIPIGGGTANECGDFILAGILNWYEGLARANHSTPVPPVAGHEYVNSTETGVTVYQGCATRLGGGMLQFKGIYSDQEFYPPDYSKTDPAEPQFLSTLYWKHQLKVSSTKDAEFSFYTGDITGRFKIIVQGVTGNDVTHGEKTFNVVKGK